MSADLTLSDLLKKVPEGGERLFRRTESSEYENMYLAVRQDANYFPWPEWHNPLPLEELPWPGSRQKKRIPISALPEMDVTFAGRSESLVDFYQTGFQAFLVSDRLASLIENMDQNSIERRDVIIKCSDEAVKFNLVMARRNIEAVDVAATNILIKDQDYGQRQFIRSVIFPDGVVFNQEKVGRALNFTEIDVAGWFWSRDLIDAAKREGIKGLYTTVPGVVTSVAVDSL